MKKLFIIAFTILSLVQIGRSQCPPDTDCNGTPWSSNITRTLISTVPDCKITFIYQTRICNGINQVRIVSTTAEGSCDPTTLRTLSKDGKELNSLTEYITLILAEQLAFDNAPSHIIPDCSSGNTQDEVQFFTAGCGVWVYCEYEISDNPPTCPKWEGAHPEFGTNPKKVRVYQWQSCGTTCCMRTYRFCLNNSATGYSGIKCTSSVPVSMTACTGQVNYSPDYVCESGCSW